MECVKFQSILSTLRFGINLGRIGGKYLTKIIFDIKSEIGTFEMSRVKF